MIIFLATEFNLILLALDNLLYKRELHIEF